jgi:hypothetical protein
MNSLASQTMHSRKSVLATAKSKVAVSPMAMKLTIYTKFDLLIVGRLISGALLIFLHTLPHKKNEKKNNFDEKSFLR